MTKETRSDEAIKLEERHAELEGKIKHEAEIAATTQKPKMAESLTMSKQESQHYLSETKTQTLQLQ